MTRRKTTIWFLPLWLVILNMHPARADMGAPSERFSLRVTFTRSGEKLTDGFICVRLLRPGSVNYTGADNAPPDKLDAWLQKELPDWTPLYTEVHEHDNRDSVVFRDSSITLPDKVRLAVYLDSTDKVYLSRPFAPSRHGDMAFNLKADGTMEPVPDRFGRSVDDLVFSAIQRYPWRAAVVTLALTLGLELGVLLLWQRLIGTSRSSLRLVVVCVLANLVTQPLLFAVCYYAHIPNRLDRWPIYVPEGIAVVVEGAMYYVLGGLRLPVAGALSVLANAASFAAGTLLCLYL